MAFASDEPSCLASARLIRDGRAPVFEGWNLTLKDAVCWLGHWRMGRGAFRAALLEQKKHVEACGRSMVGEEIQCVIASSIPFVRTWGSSSRCEPRTGACRDALPLENYCGSGETFSRDWLVTCSLFHLQNVCIPRIVRGLRTLKYHQAHGQKISWTEVA